ncbi:MAG: Mov34/MPN/PAD-1 family protein [Acidobacteriaceae bacterium]|nr:Mov34/MPN/PAD-1 family protein [Acidobacteriaceae bacterium]
MAKQFEEQSVNEAPLYIRWGADRSPYAIELKLELVSKIRQEMVAAESAGVEIGGVLVGSLPNSYSSTLRIDDIEMIPRGPQDGATFMLDPSQEDRFAEVRWQARAKERTALGLFRSHKRPGHLRPSIADRTLLSAEFQNTIHALLLVGATEPYTAGFFISADGQLPPESSVREFRFDESEFKSLPELDLEPQDQRPTQKLKSRGGPGTVAALVAIALGVVALLWYLNQSVISLPSFSSHSQQLQLAVTGENRLLHVSWNHAAKDLDHASGATLIIRNNTGVREIKLGADELRLGSVDCEVNSPSVEMTLALNKPGSVSISQSVSWKQ